MDEKFVIINGWVYNSLEAKEYIEKCNKEQEFTDSVPKPELCDYKGSTDSDKVEGVFADWVMYEKYLESCKETIIVDNKAYFMNAAKVYYSLSECGTKEAEKPKEISTAELQTKAYKNVGVFKSWSNFFSFMVTPKTKNEPTFVKDAIRIIGNGQPGDMKIFNPDGTQRKMVTKVEFEFDASEILPTVKIYEVNAKIDVKTNRYEIIKYNPIMTDIHHLVSMAMQGLKTDYPKDAILEILQDIDDIIDSASKEIKPLSEQEIKDRLEKRGYKKNEKKG